MTSLISKAAKLENVPKEQREKLLYEWVVSRQVKLKEFRELLIVLHVLKVTKERYNEC